MCTGFWIILPSSSKYKCIIIFNRDEILSRPFHQLHFWDLNKDILAAQDIPSKGTWLGFNVQTGNFSLTLNFL